VREYGRWSCGPAYADEPRAVDLPPDFGTGVARDNVGIRLTASLVCCSRLLPPFPGGPQTSRLPLWRQQAKTTSASPS
jgi:hypothetical protein